MGSEFMEVKQGCEQNLRVDQRDEDIKECKKCHFGFPIQMSHLD